MFCLLLTPPKSESDDIIEINLDYEQAKKQKSHTASNDTKLYRFKSLFNCKFCKSVYKHPIILPCGERICQKDLEIFSKSPEGHIACQLCKKEHVLPADGFPICQTLVEMLEMEMYGLNYEEMFPRYNECKNILTNLTQHLNELESLSKEPNSFINEYFFKLRKQIKHSADQLKEKIDTYANEIVETLNEAESKCLGKSKNLDAINQELNESKVLVNKLTTDFNSFQISDQILEDIIQKAINARATFENKSKKLQSIFLDENIYTFQTNELKINDIFGRLHFEGFKVRRVKIFGNFLICFNRFYF